MALALYKLQKVATETKQRNVERGVYEARAKIEKTNKGLKLIQKTVRTRQSFMKKATLVIPYRGDYQSFVNDVFPHRNETEMEVVLLTKYNKFAESFTVFSQKKFEDYIRQYWEGDSGSGWFVPDAAKATKILLFKPEAIRGVSLKQTFRESPQNNCVFVPIRNQINQILTQDMSRNTRSKYQHILDQLAQEEANFPNGVPQDEIIPLSKRLGIYIQVNDVLGNTFIENGSKNAKAKVKLTNTRENHVDNYTDNQLIELSSTEITKKYKELKKENQFYLIYNSTDEITTLKTLNGTFKVPNPDKPYIDEMNDQIRSSHIDAIQYPELNDFLKEGRQINSYLVLFKPIEANTKCWDMKNAYAQYHNSPNYEGFPYILHQFRNIDYMPSIGIYEFIINSSTPLSRLLGLYADNRYILPSPEIKWWQENGVSLSITKGAFGSSKDIEMSPEFVKKKLYNKWIGKLSSADNFRYTKHTFPANREFAEYVKTLYPHTFYYSHKKEAMVKIPNTHVNTNHHIGAFFTSYTRLNMLHVLKTLPIDSIHGLQLDAIFTSKDISSPLFREKPVREFTENDYTKSTWYEESRKEFSPENPIHELITTNTVLSGQGGSGKTYSILEDNGYVDALYIVPNHELGKRSNRKYETIHKLLGLGCEPLHATYTPKVILIDEITQIHEDLIKQTFELYPYSLILLAGDTDDKQHYQCRGGYTNNYMPIYKPTIPIVHYTNDYRATTQELKDMKIEVRNEMKRIFTDGGIADTQKIRTFIKNKYPNKLMSLLDAKEMATPEDIFLWGTHKSEKELEVGSSPCLRFQNFGIHAFQGQTIHHPTRIFIRMDWFEYAMAYTAISRATHHDQVFFVV